MQRYSVICLLFFLSFFLLFCSGRLSSGDAGAQLQASMLLVNTGTLGTSTPQRDSEGRVGPMWLQNPHGVYYQAHDIGNTLLMAPSAALGSALSKAPLAEKIWSPPILTRVAVAVTCSVISAIGCFFMFRLFSLFYTLRIAFLLSLAFATTTFFWAYSKTAFDVLGACVSVCILLYLSAKILREEQLRNRTILFAGGALALASSFRYSLAPFLVLSALTLFYLAQPKVTWRHMTLFLLVIFIGMIPTFIYNFVRTGSVLISALAVDQTNPAALEQGQWQQSLTDETVQGLFGLILSPNYGLFVSSPILLLLFAVPLVWREFPALAHRLILSFSVGTILYVLLIASLSVWSGLAWGPRYLLPILPILFFAVGMTLVSLWDKYKYPLTGLIFLSFVLNAAPVLVNWNLAIHQHPQAQNQDAHFPYQHVAVWNGLALAIEGQPLPPSQDMINNPERSGGARFPDLWTFRVMEYSTSGFLAGLTILLALAGTALKYFVELVVSRGGGSLRGPAP